ncbi:MAG: DUF1616 domain-containing protein [Natrialbaceae archaeon]|nr:DUF1616 domain-containing protein [Natrialbaceae archaeon]
MGQQTSSAFDKALVSRYPADLGLITVAAGGLYLLVPALDGGALRLAISIPLIAFVPGYSLVSVLFPTRARQARTSIEQAVNRPRGIDTVERVALAFGLSLISVPIILIAIALVGSSLTTASVLAAICLTTVVLAQLAVLRRWSVPESERFVVTLRSLVSHSPVGAEFGLSSIALLISAAAAIGILLVALTNPLAAGGYSELGLYGYDDAGNRIVGDLPSTVEPGEPIEYSLSIKNQEGEPIDYTVITQEQYLDGGTVTERIELSRTSVSVPDGDEARLDRQLSLSAPRNDPVRIRFLLYAGEPPAVPTEHNADEDVYFFVTISE